MPRFKLPGLLVIDIVEVVRFGAQEIRGAEQLEPRINHSEMHEEGSSVHVACGCGNAMHDR